MVALGFTTISAIGSESIKGDLRSKKKNFAGSTATAMGAIFTARGKRGSFERWYSMFGTDLTVMQRAATVSWPHHEDIRKEIRKREEPLGNAAFRAPAMFY